MIPVRLTLLLARLSLLSWSVPLSVELLPLVRLARLVREPKFGLESVPALDIRVTALGRPTVDPLAAELVIV